MLISLRGLLNIPMTVLLSWTNVPPWQEFYFFSPTTKYEATYIVTSLNNTHSAGPNEISNFILKGIISSIAVPLTHIFNKSILSGIFPMQMKIAKIIPWLKQGDDFDAGNYRPISLLSSLSKILERLIFTRTTNFLKAHDLFTNSQFGFRQKHSTIHALKLCG